MLSKKSKLICKFITIPLRLTKYYFRNSESKSKVHKEK